MFDTYTEISHQKPLADAMNIFENVHFEGEELGVVAEASISHLRPLDLFNKYGKFAELSLGRSEDED